MFIDFLNYIFLTLFCMIKIAKNRNSQRELYIEIAIFVIGGGGAHMAHPPAKLVKNKDKITVLVRHAKDARL